MKHKIFTGEAKPNVIRLLPALNITKESLTQVKDANVKDSAKVDAGTACPADIVENGLARKDLISETVRISGDALFDVGSSVLSASATQKLDKLIEQIKATPNVVQIKIAGHTDNTGSDMINIPLSKSRAEHVRDYLVLHGLENITIEAEGYGATRPVADNSADAGRLANRRVEVTVTRQL